MTKSGSPERGAAPGMEQACTAPAGGSPIPVVSLEELPRGALESMLEAGREIDECYGPLQLRRLASRCIGREFGPAGTEPTL